MKKIIICIVMTSFLANLGHTAESTTDCPMMKETTERTNPKANLASIKTKQKPKSSASAQ